MVFIRRAFIGGSAAWAAALPLATWSASLAHPSTLFYLFALGVYAVGGAVCHQLEVRSFHMWGRQMPVCARCAGIYAGAAAAALIAGAGAQGRRSSQHGAAVPPLLPGTVFTVALLPAVGTLIFEWTTGLTPSNLTRAATGVVAGSAVAWLVVTAETGRPARTTM